jgi:hypothetical protein
MAASSTYHKAAMSAFGPKRTFRECGLMSAFRGKADIDQPPTNLDL